MRDYSVRSVLSLLLILSISLVSFPQSGRKVQREVAPPESKPAPASEAKQIAAPEAKAAEPSAENTIKVNTTLIPVPVSVTDGSGRYVPFLKKKDFVIYEDGIRQEVAHFSDDWVPFHIVLMLDTSDSNKHAKQSILYSATKFVEGLRPNDRVMVATFDGNNKNLCDFTNDHNVVREAIQQASKDRFLRVNSSLNTRLHNVLKQNLAQIEGRKAIVLFTDGMDQEAFSCTPSRDRAMGEAMDVRLPERTFHMVEENDVVIYPIIFNEAPPPQRVASGWPGSGGILFPSSRGIGFPDRMIFLGNESRNDLRKLADFSAGRYFNADSMNDVQKAFKDIAEDLGHQYTLGYYPSRLLQPGQFHHLSVNVSGESVRVRARQSYRVPKGV